MLKSIEVALCATKNLGAGKTQTGLERPHFLAHSVAKVTRGVVPAHKEEVGTVFARAQCSVMQRVMHAVMRRQMRKGINHMALLKAPAKQAKTTMLQVRLEEDVRLNLDRYAEFLDANPSYVVSEVLKLLYRKDKKFQSWLSGQHTEAIAKRESLQLELK